MTPTGQIALQPWMQAPETAEVLAALQARGTTVRFVGGCVRDALLGKEVGDIDIATPDPPETVLALIESAGLKAVPTGLAHGTVTAIAGGVPFEVTTLRRDVETYGRHARVAFIDDWTDDAARRDFTINAMFLDPDGTLYDPFGGRADLAAGHVRFVGEARRRIDEDVLRLLRFFRFHAWYGRPPADDEALAACRELAPRLETLSGERLQAELFKLLAAPAPLPALELMADAGVMPHLLPNARAGWQARLAALVGLEDAPANGDAVRRLAAIVAAPTEALAARLRLSRADGERLAALAGAAELPAPAMDARAVRAMLYRLGPELFRDLALLAWSEAGGGEDDGFARLLAAAADWPSPELPVRGRDVLARGIPKGTAVGALLAEVERWWVAGDFRAGRAEALAYLDQLIAGQGRG
ncbi:MAG TPA: CCA tRNA nucleotidyltransferase [Alphaproteobacteria bacterium]